MTPIVEGGSDGGDIRFGIAAARWNQAITDKLVEGALRRLEEHGVREITILRVAGALELPLAAKKLAESGCDAVVAIGTVVKGETDHYDIVVNESARGITLAALDTGVPVANAVLAVHDLAHALDRAGDDDSNKGVEAVDAAITTVNAFRQLESS